MINIRDKEYLTGLKETLLDNCSKCKGIDPGCECQQKFLFEARLVLANIPPKYRPFKLEDSPRSKD